MDRKHPLAECEVCPLASARCAKTTGPQGAKIAVVSRSPGKYDVMKGRPFSGESGKVLDHLLKMNGVNREDVLVTNVVLCETDNPPKEAIDACKVRLQTEINAAETIIAAGAEAVKELTKATSIHGARGFVHERLNFASNGQRVIATSNPAVVLRKAENFPDLVKDFRLALKPKPIPELPTVRYTDDLHEAERWIQTILKACPPRLSSDLETQGLVTGARIVAIGLSSTGSRAVAFGKSVCGDTDFLRRYFGPLYEDRRIQFVWHNGKFDVKQLRAKGIKARVDQDTLLMSYCLDERPGSHSLDYLLMDELGWPMYEPESVKKWKSRLNTLTKQHRYAELDGVEFDEDELYTYNGFDTAGTAQLYPIYAERLQKYNRLLASYASLLIPGSEALTRIELRGFRYDVNKAADILESEVVPALETFKYDLQEIVEDAEYNPNSAPQNSSIVYDADKLGVLHFSINLNRSGKEKSVDDSVREELKAGRYDIRRDSTWTEYDVQAARDRIEVFAHRLTEFKRLDKQRGTYIQGLIPRAEYFGRIYTNFNITGTVAGRLSSSGPNIQNVTRGNRHAGIPNIRKLFVASEGCRLIQADYSQAELRTIAELSQDEKLIEVYKDNLDLHNMAAERLFGPNYTKEQRSTTKNANFGVTYGQSAETFQEKHGLPLAKGLEHIKWWWSTFTGVKAWRDEVHRLVLKQGYVETPFGRRRRFPLITKENRNEVFREAVNFLVQSTAADFTLWSTIELDKLDIPMVNSVHDAVVSDSPVGVWETHAKLIKEVMESAAKETLDWKLPFTVEVSIGENWGELTECDLTQSLAA